MDHQNFFHLSFRAFVELQCKTKHIITKTVEKAAQQRTSHPYIRTFFTNSGHSVTDSLKPSSSLTQESGDVIVDLIPVGCVVKLQVDVRAEIILSAENLKALSERRRAHGH